MGIPKFTYSKSVEGALSQGEYVHHNNHPMLIGEVIRGEGGRISLKIIRNPENALPEKVAKLTTAMTDWFYHAYVAAGKA